MPRSCVLESPFEAAKAAARKRGSCPLRELDDWLFERWDVVALCREFSCAECVALPGEWEPEGFDGDFETEALEEAGLPF